jgi:hypothetical protein
LSATANLSFRLPHVSVRTVSSAVCLAFVVMAALAANAFAGVAGFAAAKAFHRYPVYWAGAKVLGVPLEDIEGHAGFEKHAPSGWSFNYGTCELPETDEPSCALPVEIQVDSTCTRWADELNRPADLVPFRGAIANWRLGAPGPGEHGVEIFTGRVTIVVFVEPFSLKQIYHLSDPEKVASQVMDRLRTVHQAGPRPLPPPVPGSLAGGLPCQKRTAEEFE